MNTTKKILVALIAVVIVAASIAFGWYIGKHPAENNKNDDKPYISVDDSNTVGSTSDKNEAEDKTPSDTTDPDMDNNSQDKDASENDNSSNNDSEANKNSLDKLIIGSWTDNANFSGYEFMDDGIMKVTYFNMELLDLDDVISGTYTGTYTLEGNKLTVNYTIYSKAVIKTYSIKVDENTLTLKDSSGDSAIYVRKGASTKMDNIDTALLGSWKSNLNGYKFEDTGVVAITYIDLSSMGITLPFDGTVNGVYEIDEDVITIKYSIYTGVIKKKFRYSIDGKVLTLIDLENGDKGTYIKNDN